MRGTVLALCALILLLGAPPAFADGTRVGADLSVAQSLGDRELTVVIRRVQPVPGRLPVDVVSHAGSPPGSLTLGVSPTGAGAPDDGLPPPGTVTSSTVVVLGDRPGPHPAALTVDRPGPWELALDDGERVARIPFIVAAPIVMPWEIAAYGGFVAAGVLLLVALVTAVRASRSWLTLVPAGGLVAALAVAVTGAVLSASAPPPQQPGQYLDPTVDSVGEPYPGNRLTIDYSRPPANLAVTATGAAGQPMDVDLRLHDSATGLPVDDLLVHDNALIHLVVIGPSGRLWHLHPVRIGAGSYHVRFTPTDSGRYALAAELARRGGGVQLARSALTVGADSGPSFPEPPGLGERVIDGTTVNLAAGSLTSGTPATITARVGDTRDLQLWLGMLGHMIVVGPLPEGEPVGSAAATTPVWAHAHAMKPERVQPDETVAAYGPDITFTYTFPSPGRYRIWVQAERDYRVLTVPATIDIREAGA